MNHIDFVKNQNQTTKQRAPALIWVIASIMFHMLILLLIMTYKFDMFEQNISKPMHQDNKMVLWTNQPQQTPLPPTQPEPQQKTPDENKNELKQDIPKKMPTIIAGKQGIDEQNIDGKQHPYQYPKDIAKHTKETSVFKSPEKEISQESFPKQEPLYKTTPLQLPKGNIFVTSTPKQSSKNTDANQSMHHHENEATNMYKHVPIQTKETPIQTISFKNIGLGQNNLISTFGNSAHMGIQGDSPDIPTGEELKYITYLNQMANMIVSSMHANPQKNLIPNRTYEQVIFHVKVDRAGNLLTTRIINPSKYQVINIFILESVKQVGLFNALPNFIKKDTFEINWRISM